MGTVDGMVPMRAHALAFPLISATTVALAACGGGATTGGATSPTTVTLFAAASTATAMAKEIAAFERQDPAVRVAADYEGTQALLTKLEAEPGIADVLLSADTKHMNTAVARGLVTSPRLLAANHLVIAVPQGNPAHITGLADLAKPGVHLVLADASVPAGSYAEQTLHLAETRGDAASGFAAKALANVVSRETDVEQVVAKVASGEVDAGVVYATDAIADHHINAIAIPPADQPPAVYPVAVTAQSRAAADARAFVAFLLSAAGQQILRDAGFAPPPS